MNYLRFLAILCMENFLDYKNQCRYLLRASERPKNYPFKFEIWFAYSYHRGSEIRFRFHLITVSALLLIRTVTTKITDPHMPVCIETRQCEK